MRFASIGGQSNYAQAGKAVADDAARTFKAARRNSVDFDGLAQSAMKNKSNENIAQTRADTVVKKAEINEEGRKTKMKAAKAGVMRKAGGLIALGVGGLAEKSEKSDYSLFDKKIAGIKAKNDADRVTMAGIDTSGKKAETPANTGGTAASSASTTSSSATPMKSGDTAMNMMRDLTADGYSSTQAAAITGNAQYESANFTAHEEYAPNAYGTKGAGYFQWTNAGGSNRRDNFENYAKNNKLDPRSYQANTGFMMHELKGGAGNHWTGGMNDQGFRQIGDLSTAVNAFQNNYLRPAKETANTSQRLSNAQNILQQFQSQNS
jgi:hypothetical protein